MNAPHADATPAPVSPRFSGTLVRTASVPGREHLRLGRNNQDGVAVAERGLVSVAVVCDGCSSESRSEVGAHLGARFLAGWVAARAAEEPLSAELAERATAALTAWMERVAASVDPSPEAFGEVLQRHFLFTFLCAVTRGGQALVFGLGDGALQVDGRSVLLDAGPQNAPDYAAYRLLSEGPLAAQVHFLGAARRLAVATDGFDGLLRRDPGALQPLFEDEVVWRNPVHLQRRLNVLASRERFSDDATLALLSTEG